MQSSSNLRLKEVSNLVYNRRGQMVQLVFVIVLVFALIIGYVALNMVSNEVNDMVQAEDGISDEAKVVIEENTNSFPDVFDAGLSLVLVISLLICLGLAWVAPNNPMMLIIALFIIVSLGFAGMIFSNTWESMTAEGDLNTFSSDFPISGFFLDHYLSVILVFGFLTLTVYVIRSVGGY